MFQRLIPLVAALATALALLSSAAPAAAAPSNVFVTIDGANLRSAPSTSASVVGTANSGDKLAVTGTVTGSAVNGDSTWYATSSGSFISEVVVSTAGPATAADPSTFGSVSGRWVDVDLTNLVARAMQGNQVVFSVPVDTGKPGWDTPTGTFSVLSKTPVTDMRSGAGWSEQYVQPAVPWVMYFTPFGHALHGNYWVPASWFGTMKTSHGCVGMSVASAQMFYNFTVVGTPIHIHY